MCSLSQEAIQAGLAADEAERVSCALFCDVAMQTATHKLFALIFTFFEYQHLHVLHL